MTWPRPPALLRRTVLLLLAGLPAAALSACGEPDRPELRGFTPDGAAEQRAVETRLLGSFSADTMSAHHEHMTAEPHHAASEANRRYAEYYADVLRSYGFDDVRLIEYEALIPRPTTRQITVLDPERRELPLEEPRFDEDPSSSAENVLTPYNAYSGDGDVTAEVVYVNYGLPRDYEVLDSLGVSVEGKIALARYGMSWRGIKPRLAARHGAVGTILYSDPEDDGYVEGDTLPVGKWRPSRGVQSGSVMDMPTYPGDPQTPGRPSVPGAERIPRAEAETILDIPVLPISYGNAEHILRHLEGPRGPEEWQGGLDLPYRAGPGATRVRLRVESDWSVRPFVNVIGILRGSEEPEKMVMAGAHRDAWTFGGRDPISGAVSLLEVGRRLGQLASEGLRPRRSVALASWGAEEYGLIGSTEYGEHFADSLQGRLVAYLNRESYTAGDFEAGGVHSLEPFLNGIARTVQMPDTAATIHDHWTSTADSSTVREPTSTGGVRQVRLDALGSGSDYTVFLDHLGIPAADVGFSSGNGIYHSKYDSRWFFTQFGDPGFRYGETLSEVAALFLLRLANADVLPFDYERTAETMTRYRQELSALADSAGLADSVDLGRIDSSVEAFRAAAAAVNEEVGRTTSLERSSLTAAEADTLRRVNELLLQVERDFLTEEGLPGRPWFRHQLYAPGFYTGYGVKTLPGVREALEQGDVGQARRMTDRLVRAVDRARNTLVEAAEAARTVGGS